MRGIATRAHAFPIASDAFAIAGIAIVFERTQTTWRGFIGSLAKQSATECPKRGLSLVTTFGHRQPGRRSCIQPRVSGYMG